jgi:excisionase family DNA binding protein
MGGSMSEPAHEIKKDSLALEGFENLLEQEHAASEIVPNPAQEPAHEDTGIVQEVDAIALEVPEGYWTTEEAAKHLGISQRTVFKRLKDGSLKGMRVQGKFRQEWRIEPVHKAQTVLEVVQERDDSIMNTIEQLQEPIHEELKRVPEPSSGSATYIPELDRMLAVIREKDQLLQAATYRNGYLEAQLETHKEQIKLLPDYQHKATEAAVLSLRVSELETELERYRRTSWSRFWSWFTGK